MIFFQGLNQEFGNAYQYRERPNFLVQQTVIKVADEQNEHDDKKNGTKEINNPRIIVENSAKGGVQIMISNF